MSSLTAQLTLDAMAATLALHGWVGLRLHPSLYGISRLPEIYALVFERRPL